jgi:superfamily II DNA/RNA helicase
MGFESTLKSIIEYLPRCQTLLFSATLNNQVKLLANLSMNEPEKIFLHEKDGENGVRKPGENIYEIPVKLVQYYMIVEAE